MLGGELAAPCYLQSAIAEPNAFPGGIYGRQRIVRNVDSKVLCNAMPWTVSGQECSSTKRIFACAMRKLWRSHLRCFRFGKSRQKRLHSFIFEKTPIFPIPLEKSGIFLFADKGGETKRQPLQRITPSIKRHFFQSLGFIRKNLCYKSNRILLQF